MGPRRLFQIVAISGLLASCSGSSMTMDQMVQWVQDRSVAICSYLPAATSTAQVILATNATLEATLETIANAICQSVASWQKETAANTLNAMVMPCPRVNGICIEGQFVTDQTKGN